MYVYIHTHTIHTHTQYVFIYIQNISWNMSTKFKIETSPQGRREDKMYPRSIQKSFNNYALIFQVCGGYMNAYYFLLL